MNPKTQIAHNRIVLEKAIVGQRAACYKAFDAAATAMKLPNVTPRMRGRLSAIALQEEKVLDTLLRLRGK